MSTVKHPNKDKPSSHSYIILLIITLASLFLWLSQTGHMLENRAGLNSLFLLRGEMPQPQGTVIVNIDEDSFNELQTSERVSEWDRRLHAQLIQRLNEMGAQLIIFDIAFKTPSEAIADQSLQESLHQSNNVILIKDMMPIQYANIPIQKAARIMPPLKIFNDEATVASFILPTLGKQILGYTPLFIDHLSSSTASIPIIALQMLSPNETSWLVQNINTRQPSQALIALKQLSHTELAETLHQRLKNNPSLTNELLEKAKKQPANGRLKSLISSYASQHPVYINYYGNTQTIKHIPYHQVINTNTGNDKLRQLIKNQVVFVGRTYQQITKQADTHYNAFTPSNKPGMSGVEIMASVFSNLYDGSTLHTLKNWQALLLIISFCIFAFLAIHFLYFKYSLLSIVVVASIYSIIAIWLFSKHHLLLPVALPIFILCPLFLLWAILRYTLITRSQSEHALKTLRHYLPDYAIESVVKQNLALKQTHLIEAACLLTDIKGFTTFSEQHEAQEVHDIMNQYYTILNQTVSEHGGQVVNILGDGLLAIWTDKSGPSSAKRNACKAALDIIKTTDQFCQRTNKSLTTCIGIHYGPASVGDLGSDKHFEYAPVGDTVNTTAKIEAYNRGINTRILISESIYNNDIKTKTIGETSLPGKQKPVYLYELISTTNI